MLGDARRTQLCAYSNASSLVIVATCRHGDAMLNRRELMLTATAALRIVQGDATDTRPFVRAGTRLVTAQVYRIAGTNMWFAASGHARRDRDRPARTRLIGRAWYQQCRILACQFSLNSVRPTFRNQPIQRNAFRGLDYAWRDRRTLTASST
jgi:hypothetical protein